MTGLLSTEFSLTAGVRRTDDALVHATLGIVLPAEASEAEAADLGLMSIRARVRIGLRTVALPPWFHPSARPLPPGVARAVIASVVHNACGMSFLLVAAAAAVAVGAALSAPAVLALGTVALLGLCSVLVHEAGHVAAHRILLPPDTPGILVVRGMSCHLVRPRGTPAADAGITAAGAIAPLLAAGLTVPAAGIAPLAVIFAVLIAVAHAAALLIPVGDGASLRHALQELRASRAV